VLRGSYRCRSSWLDAAVRPASSGSAVAPHRSLFPEVSIQLAFPFEAWWPYVGIGGGYQQILDGGGGSNGTVHGAVGVRRRLSRHWGVRAEVRGRVIVPTSFIADFTWGWVDVLTRLDELTLEGPRRLMARPTADVLLMSRRHLPARSTNALSSSPREQTRCGSPRAVS
jgi:hypothetical protein